MKTLELQIADEVAAKIEEAARARGVTVEELVESSVDERIEREAAFDEAAKTVLAKNADCTSGLLSALPHAD